jgi:hypothetical protein
MVQMINTVFRQFYVNTPELQRATMNTVVFLLFHEVGHALTDVYDLSVRGPEEDIVDNFSMFLLTSSGNPDLEQAAADAADFFYGFNNLKGNPVAGLEEYLDVHSMDLQRFYSILTLLYGKDPDKYQYLVEMGVLPPSTTSLREGYVRDYQKSMASWKRDLAGKMKQPAAPVQPASSLRKLTPLRRISPVKQS